MKALNPVGAALLATVMFILYRFLQKIDAGPLLIWLYGSVALFFVVATLRALLASFRWDRMLRAMTTPSGLYGPATFPAAEEADTIGLIFSNPDGNSIPLGGTGDKIIYYDGPGHISIRASTNAGKTESSAAPICYALGAHRNIIATAKGAELAFLCGPYRQNVLKQTVIYIDPWREMKKYGMPSHDFNPVGHFTRYVQTQSPELLDKAFAVALMLIPEAANASGENKIFRSHARDLQAWCFIKLAIDEAETGELVCNIPTLKKILGGSNKDLQFFLQEMRSYDHYAGSVSRGADRFLAMLERSPKLAESVLSEALSSLTLYDPASVLGRTTLYSDFDPRDLKDPQKPISVFIVVPPEKTMLYGPHIGICLNTLMETCIEADRFEPRVTVVADEFASCGVLPSALPTLFLGRSRGVQLITYVQSTKSYELYRDAEAFTTQSECVLSWSIRSTRDAETYSKRSGQRSIVTESASIPRDAGLPGSPSLSLSEKGIPNFRPDEFMQLGDFEAALFYKQHAPLVVDLVSYRAVKGWREHARPMPGAPPLKHLPVKYTA